MYVSISLEDFLKSRKVLTDIAEQEIINEVQYTFIKKLIDNINLPGINDIFITFNEHFPTGDFLDKWVKVKLENSVSKKKIILIDFKRSQSWFDDEDYKEALELIKSRVRKYMRDCYIKLGTIRHFIYVNTGPIVVALMELIKEEMIDPEFKIEKYGKNYFIWLTEETKILLYIENGDVKKIKENYLKSILEI